MGLGLWKIKQFIKHNDGYWFQIKVGRRLDENSWSWLLNLIIKSLNHQPFQIIKIFITETVCEQKTLNLKTWNLKIILDLCF